jgi:hypothetical protein
MGTWWADGNFKQGHVGRENDYIDPSSYQKRAFGALRGVPLEAMLDTAKTSQRGKTILLSQSAVQVYVSSMGLDG